MTPSGAAAGAYKAAQTVLSSAGTLSGASGVAGPAGGGSGFGQMLSKALEGVAETGRKADTQAVAAANGKANLVDVVTAVAEGETAIQTLVAVRDRMIAAYDEIMRMQV